MEIVVEGEEKHLAHGELTESRMRQAEAIERPLAPTLDRRMEVFGHRLAPGHQCLAGHFRISAQRLRPRCETAGLDLSGGEAGAVGVAHLGIGSRVPQRKTTPGNDQRQLRQS